ncbi:hypothetical protein SteCoe_28087 [Stentor coeruleus]|uniref:Uncharacterized protein n=1 Tax=Stentor coeruleus TaxID=5963 RepID=A0A1R2B923_9CILI|nr:hypothetical protein SteCoe_28087 [Stentor coeruleus]
MRICVFISLSLLSTLILSWLLLSTLILSWLIPLIDNFSSVYPDILLIEGIKNSNDPPLLSALLKTLQHFEGKPKEVKTSEKPLYDELTFIVPVLSQNNTINLLLIKNELSIENLASPIITNLLMVERSLDDFFDPPGKGWQDLWKSAIFGNVYFISSTNGIYDLILVYQVNLPQGTSQYFRYYPERSKPEYYDYKLPASNQILCLSIYNDIIVYSVDQGFYLYHTLKKVIDDNMNITWEEISHGEVHNRKNFGLSESTGVKIINSNGSIYLLRSIVKANEWLTSSQLELNVLKFQYPDWVNMGVLYNLTLNDYSIDPRNTEDLKAIPRIRISKGNSIYIGHYGMALMYIYEFPNYFQAYHLAAGYMMHFNKIDVSENGEFAIFSIPGYLEKEKLKYVRVQQVNESAFENNFEIALDHLPSVLLEKTIRDFKIIQRNNDYYVLIFYSNGAVVLIDFKQAILDK